MDRADLGRGAVRLENLHDPLHLVGRQPRHVLAVVDRHVVLVIRVVGCQGAAGYRGEDLVADRFQPPPELGPRRGVVLVHPFQAAIGHPEIQPAVLADHAGDRPHPRQVIAPAGRPARDRHHRQAGVVRPPERRVRLGGDLAVRRDRVVDVREQADHRVVRPVIVRTAGISARRRWLFRRWPRPFFW